MAYDLRYDNWVKANSIPDIASVVASARAFLDSTEQWQSGKTYHGSVRTLYKKVEGESSWYVRVSDHDGKDGVGFDQLWWALGVDHSKHESEYVPDLKTATMLNRFEEGRVEAWELFYKFPPPISPRAFDVLVVTSEPNTTPREALFISLPYAPDEEEDKKAEKPSGTVKGKYCSMERIKEDATGKVEWRMAVQSSAAGLVPRFLQEINMASKISDDVPYVQKWLKEHPLPTS